MFFFKYSQLPAFTPRLTRRRCCFQHQQHIDNLSQQSLLMLMWDQSSDSSHFLHQKFRLWWCHSYMRDQTPLVNNRLRRLQPLVQGDRQHRDNLSPKSPSCLDASSDSGTPLVNTDYGEPNLWDKATDNTEIIFPQNPLIPFWAGHGDREPLGETVCVVSGVVTS